MMIGTYTTLFDSPITPWSTLATLVVVMAISMAKEALEDVKRHQADAKTNGLIAKQLNKFSAPESDGNFSEIAWRNIKVGNIIKIVNNEQLPADIVLLTTSEPFGTAFVETSNIDGESNLKLKNSAKTAEHGCMWTKASEITR
jgi:phospholipid-transporting ATPase